MGGSPAMSRLRDLIDMVESRAMARLEDSDRLSEHLEPAERREIARRVGMAALKFADLSNPRVTDYVFDLDRFLAFEGKTGPYLLYAVVRITSVLEKAGAKAGCELAEIRIVEDSERELALALGNYADAMQAAYEKRMPHILCDHAYQVAQAFSKFYAACRIKDEADKGLRASRIALSAAARRQLRAILTILGIDIPDRM